MDEYGSAFIYDYIAVSSVKVFLSLKVWHVSFGNHFLLEGSLNILFFRLFFVIIVYSKVFYKIYSSIIVLNILFSFLYT